MYEVYLLVGIIVPLVTLYLLWKRRPPVPSGSDNSPKEISIQEQLLRYFWNYPVTQISEAFAEQSWAVKESLVLKGQLSGAREKPGLGAAILSVDLALKIFSRTALDGRITEVISWAMKRASKEPPHLIMDEIVYPQESRTEEVSDFRHTLAFAAILSMTGRLPTYRDTYLQLTLNRQRPDGGWDAGSGESKSELLSSLYALIFLGTTQNGPALSEEMACQVGTSMRTGLDWIVGEKRGSGLWHSDHVPDSSGGDVLTSAWVLQGMSLLGTTSHEAWRDCAQEAVRNLVACALQETCWKEMKNILRFRVEARVASAIAQSQPDWIASSTTRDQIDEYLNAWYRRAESQLKQLSENDWDLSTVTYLIYSFGVDNFSDAIVREVESSS